MPTGRALADAAQVVPDDDLVAAMDEIREIASVALSVRKAAGLRVRQPLAALTVATRGADPAAAVRVSLVADEVNVRLVELTEMAEHDERVSRRLAVNARAAGPRLGRDVQKVIKASKAGDWSVDDDGVVICGGVVLEPARVHAGAGGDRVVLGRRRSAAVRWVRVAGHRPGRRTARPGRGQRPAPAGAAGPQGRRA